MARTSAGLVLLLDTERPAAMLPCLSMATLPIQRNLVSRLSVPCWKAPGLPAMPRILYRPTAALLARHLHQVLAKDSPQPIAAQPEGPRTTGSARRPDVALAVAAADPRQRGSRGSSCAAMRQMKSDLAAPTQAGRRALAT